MNIDLIQENNKHLGLKDDLHSFITGKTDRAASLNCYHYDCSLGKWLYKNGIDTYRGMPEIHQLERIHSEMHHLINDLIEESKNGRTEKSLEAYKKVEEIA